MTPQFAAEGLEGLVSLAALVLFFVGPVRWFAIDWARERMFAARDRLYDEAIRGQVEFDDPSFNTVRTRINDNIRFAHSGSLLEVVAHVLAGSAKLAPSPTHELRETVDRIQNERVRAVAHIAIDRVEITSVMLLVMKSPFSSVVVSLALAPRLIALWAKARPNAGRWDWLRPYADQIQAEVPALARARR